MSIVRYWLVDHPTISEFEWKRGATFGSTPQFVALMVLTYLSVIFILQKTDIVSAPALKLLRIFVMGHNLSLLILSATMAAGCFLSALSRFPDPRWVLCFPAAALVQQQRRRQLGPVLFWAYVFYLSKILEFFDTVFIVLAGKAKAKDVKDKDKGKDKDVKDEDNNSSNRQLSFLHVYHHTFTVVACYLWVDTVQSMFPLGLVMNASVHTVMYAYYLSCAAGIRPSWKRAVTEFQILQFLTVIPPSALMLYYHFFLFDQGCSGFRSWCFSAVFALSILCLFVDFHSKNYTNAKKRL